MKFQPKSSILAIASASLGLEYSAVVPADSLFKSEKSAAVVVIRGPLMQFAHPCFDSYEAIDCRVDAALASSAATLVLDINSPGGEVAGAFELSRHIRDAAKAAGKRVVAFVDGMAASAAYAIACAGESIYATPSSIIGSIGTIKMICDTTAADRAAGVAVAVVTSGARKADGNPHVPLTEGTIAAAQHEIDAAAGLFFDLVSGARGIPSRAVAGLQAATFLAGEAQALRLIDEVSTYDAVLAIVASGETSAQTGEESNMTAREQALAALRALAKSDDAEDAKYAKAALKAMGEPDGDEEKKAEHSEPDGDEEKKASAEVPEEKKDEEEKKQAPEATKASANLSLLATVQSLTARLDAREQAEERTSLMASRPDFAPEVKKFLAKQPIEAVREAVKMLPRIAHSSPVTAAIAATTVSATRGEGQSDGDGIANLSGNAELLDSAMGAKAMTNPVSFDRNVMGIRAMTRAEARAFIARQAKAAEGSSK